MPDIAACIMVALATLLFVVLMAGPEFFRPLGCPYCGAPEPTGNGWLRCPECRASYWRNGASPNG